MFLCLAFPLFYHSCFSTLIPFIVHLRKQLISKPLLQQLLQRLILRELSSKHHLIFISSVLWTSSRNISLKGNIYPYIMYIWKDLYFHYIFKYYFAYTRFEVLLWQNVFFFHFQMTNLIPTLTLKGQLNVILGILQKFFLKLYSSFYVFILNYRSFT